MSRYCQSEGTFASLCSPSKFPFELRLRQVQHSWPAMGAIPRVAAQLQLRQHRPHLIKLEGLPGSDRAVAGKSDSHLFAPSFRPRTAHYGLYHLEKVGSNV